MCLGTLALASSDGQLPTEDGFFLIPGVAHWLEPGASSPNAYCTPIPHCVTITLCQLDHI
ncbi:hypothetical protein BJV78DRAFT_1224074, partial [Lactifluus subvellereus]